MSLKLICFDLDNTLWPVERVIANAEKAVHQWVQETHPQVAPAYHRDNIVNVRNEILGKTPEYASNLTRLRKEVLKAIFTSSGFSEYEATQHAEQGFNIFYEKRNKVEFFPDAVDALEELGKQYTLAALSNGNANLEKIGIDHLVSIHHSAESTGRKKPAPDMFHAALADAGTSPRHALHVGDHPVEDIEAARNVGMQTVWANITGGEWPEDTRRADHEINSLKDLLTLVRQID